MGHAGSYRFGHHPKAQRKKAKGPRATDGRLFRLDAKDKGRRRGSKGQSQIRPGGNASDAFLKTRFLPRLESDEDHRPTGEEINTLERGFYESLSRLAEHYKGFVPPETRSFGYPYNIALALDQAQDYLKQTGNLKLHWVQEDEGKSFLITNERYHTGSSLFYIPVIPLYAMLRDRTRKQAGKLLLSVFAYLYHIVDVPYYRQEDSYLHWIYEMHRDWAEEMEDAGDTSGYKRDLGLADLIGDLTEKKIFNRHNLKFFSGRINNFKSQDEFDRQCYRVGLLAYELFRDFGDTSIFRHGSYRAEHPESMDEAITMEKYISFIAHTEGCLYEALSECINTDFGEYMDIEEPVILHRFDGSKPPAESLAFENRVFPLIDELCCLLLNYDRK